MAIGFATLQETLWKLITLMVVESVGSSAYLHKS